MAGQSRAGTVGALILTVVLGAAACGNDPDTSAPTDADPASTVGATPDPGSDSPGAGDDTPVGDFCQLNDELARLFGELAPRTGADAEATWLNIEVVVELLQQEAPPELADDVATGATYYAEVGEALRATSFEDPVGVIESMPQGAEMEQVEARVDDYLDANC